MLAATALCSSALQTLGVFRWSVAATGIWDSRSKKLPRRMDVELVVSAR